MEELYKIPKKSRIGIGHLEFKNIESGKLIEELNFYHIDGLYSYCTDDDENVINLKVNTPVEFIRAL